MTDRQTEKKMATRYVLSFVILTGAMTWLMAIAKPSIEVCVALAMTAFLVGVWLMFRYDEKYS